MEYQEISSYVPEIGVLTKVKLSIDYKDLPQLKYCDQYRKLRKVADKVELSVHNAKRFEKKESESLSLRELTITLLGGDSYLLQLLDEIMTL